MTYNWSQNKKLLNSNSMRKKYSLISLSFLLVNLLVLTTFFGSDLLARSAKPESPTCDCSEWYGGAGDGCIQNYSYVYCYYPEGPFGYPQWIWEPYMECVEGDPLDYCDCDWEFNECEESN